MAFEMHERQGGVALDIAVDRPLKSHEVRALGLVAQVTAAMRVESAAQAIGMPPQLALNPYDWQAARRG